MRSLPSQMFNYFFLCLFGWLVFPVFSIRIDKWSKILISKFLICQNVWSALLLLLDLKLRWSSHSFNSQLSHSLGALRDNQLLVAATFTEHLLLTLHQGKCWCRFCFQSKHHIFIWHLLYYSFLYFIWQNV